MHFKTFSFEESLPVTTPFDAIPAKEKAMFMNDMVEEKAVSDLRDLHSSKRKRDVFDCFGQFG